ILGGHPAEVGYTDGAYINIVTRSGGNKFSGGATIYYFSEDTAQVLWTEEQLSAMGVAGPEFSKYDFDGSFTLGGPIIRDKIWFFTNARYLDSKISSPFRPTTILGKKYEAFDLPHREIMSFVKLTSQVSPSLRWMGMFNFTDIYEPYFKLGKGWNKPPETHRVWDERGYTFNTILNWIINPNTFLDLRVGYVYRDFGLPMRDEAKGNWRGYDYYTGYYFKSARFNEIYLRKRFQTGAYLTRFQDEFLGGDHEFKMGVEFEEAYGDWNWWRKDNLAWWAYWNESPWFFDRFYGPGSGIGLLYFAICSDEKDKSKIIDKARRIGAYIQDTYTIADRLTLNLGIRYDYTTTWKPPVTKGEAGNPVARWIGANILYPQYGIDPFTTMESEEWKDIMVWHSFSPRFGATFDVFGDGKTVLKASFNRYTEYLMLQYFSVLHPFYPRYFGFIWFDYDMDGIPETTDGYRHIGTSPKVMDPELSKKKLHPDTKSPYTDELIVGIERELFKDFSVSLSYIYKIKKKILEDVLYDPDTGRAWYTHELAPEWWIPFTTIVPSYDGFPETEVTLYALSNDAPDIFYQFMNVPEAKREYQALELAFHKRMSEGWQLQGSIVWSKAEGNIGGWYGESWGWSGAFDTANWWVNRYGRISIDRPLAIKLMGTFELPYKIYFSFYYRHLSGSPWGRSVTVRFPTSWMLANNINVDEAYWSIMVETPGTRRNRASDYLDLRVEKEFSLGKYGRIGAYVDVLNVLGYSNVSIGQNPGGTWMPVAPNTNVGTYIPSGTYKVITGVTGSRVVKFSIRWSF
ncbi:TonB-dependent receptor, partial [Candidatus Aminicenantes bacterium AH-873-B07]|nr:TonB-dependent receptor [Candidatus Aminicenantes bacterium AH-873-B07]